MHGKLSEADEDPAFEPLSEAVEFDSTEYQQAGVRLLAKVYEVDPFVCPRCGSEMKVIAVIQDVEVACPVNSGHEVFLGNSPRWVVALGEH